MKFDIKFLSVKYPVNRCNTWNMRDIIRLNQLHGIGM